ncbi:ZipA [Giardia lamblia P15]|uniref:ZipA n=1 Tax=Giardia intestinalis (strain P15) TaxID=658858 RepID=E1EZ19_GIAIA|nr:ZipA [Giardia lamblia P15]
MFFKMDDYVDDPSDDALFDDQDANAGGLGREKIGLHTNEDLVGSRIAFKQVKPSSTSQGRTNTTKHIPVQPTTENNQEMIETIRTLTEENALLLNKVKELTKDAPTSEKGSIKKVIVDLNTQIRQLTSVNERYKSKISELEQVNKVLTAETSQLSGRLEVLAKRQQEQPSKSTSARGSQLSSKVSHDKDPDDSVLLKLGQMNIQINALTKENTMLKTVLQKETGEDWTTLKVKSLSTTYRGRSEEISLLRGKLASAQDHIQQLEAELANARGLIEVPDNPETAYLGEESRAANYIATIREQYHTQIDNLTADVQRQADRLTEKDARIKELMEKDKKNSVRIASLNNELNVVKTGAKTMLAKAKHDDLTIELLRKYVDSSSNQSRTRDMPMYDQLILAENTAKASEAKLKAVMQTTKSSSDQAVYVAAAARLEAHELRAVVERLQYTVDIFGRQIRELETSRGQINNLMSTLVSSSSTSSELHTNQLSLQAYEAQLASKDFELQSLHRVVEQLTQAFVDIGGQNLISTSNNSATTVTEHMSQRGTKEVDSLLNTVNGATSTTDIADAVSTLAITAANQAVAKHLIEQKPKRLKRTKEVGEEMYRPLSTESDVSDVGPYEQLVETPE